MLDEFGGLSGLVTLEDILELVVGEIEDEFDLKHESAVEEIDGGWRVAGFLSLRRLESVLHRNIAQPEDIDSVGGLVNHVLGSDADPGSTITWHGLRFEVETVTEGRADRIVVKNNPPGHETAHQSDSAADDEFDDECGSERVFEFFSGAAADRGSTWPESGLISRMRSPTRMRVSTSRPSTTSPMLV